jgi:hypothetical protein
MCSCWTPLLSHRISLDYFHERKESFVKLCLRIPGVYINIKIAVLCDVTPPILDVAVGVSAENTGAIFRQIKFRT